MEDLGRIQIFDNDNEDGMIFFDIIKICFSNFQCVSALFRRIFVVLILIIRFGTTNLSF